MELDKAVTSADFFFFFLTFATFYTNTFQPLPSVSFFPQGNCDLATKDGNGDTALDLALRGDWKLVVRRLIEDYEKRGTDDEPEEKFSQVTCY